MSATKSKQIKKGLTKRKTVVVNKKVKDYGDDPFVVKKAKAAESFLRKHGLPSVHTR